MVPRRSFFFISSLVSIFVFIISITATVQCHRHRTVLVSEPQTVSAMFQAIFSKTSQQSDEHWQLVQKISLDFNTYHPQGMVKIGNDFFLSSVEVTERPIKFLFADPGQDRSPGKGTGHIFHFDNQGRLIRKISIGEGDLYHPGGIDTDGAWIWIPISEYRPNSQSTVYKLNLTNFSLVKAFDFQDHITAISYNIHKQSLHGMNWDTQLFYAWTPNGKVLRQDHKQDEGTGLQDCHYAGDNSMLCSRQSKHSQYRNGSLVLVDLNDHSIILQVEAPKITGTDIILTRNAMTFELFDDHLRFYFIPEDEQSIMYIIDLS